MSAFLLNDIQLIQMLTDVAASASVVQVCQTYGICHDGPAASAGEWGQPVASLGARCGSRYCNCPSAQFPPQRRPGARCNAGIRPRRFREGWLHQAPPAGERAGSEMYARQGGWAERLGPSTASTHRAGLPRRNPLEWRTTFASTAKHRTGQRRHYTDAFKVGAVAVARSIGRSAAARQLRMPLRTLDGWLHRARSAWSCGSWT